MKKSNIYYQISDKNNNRGGSPHLVRFEKNAKNTYLKDIFCKNF